MVSLIPIYSIPFWKSEYPEFQEKKDLFLDTIKNYKETNKSIQKSNIYGYHSPKTLHESCNLAPLFEYICQIGFKAFSDLDFIDCDIAITSAWLNINNNRQCMNYEHVHSSVLSGTFYLKVPKESGKIVFKNPTINAMWDGFYFSDEKNQFTAERVCIEPLEGDIFLFPSYLPHSVETNNHDEERISISFNLTAIPKRRESE